MGAQSLMFAVWANNPGDVGEALADVRTERHADTALAEAPWSVCSTSWSLSREHH